MTPKAFVLQELYMHWPDYYSTGIEQLKNSKNVSIKTDLLITAIYDYYVYSSYQEEVTPVSSPPKWKNYETISLMKNYLLQGQGFMLR